MTAYLATVSATTGVALATGGITAAALRLSPLATELVVGAAGSAGYKIGEDISEGEVGSASEYAKTIVAGAVSGVALARVSRFLVGPQGSLTGSS